MIFFCGFIGRRRYSCICPYKWTGLKQQNGRRQKRQNFQNVNFETTKLNVQSVLKGDIKDGERISLLQTVSDLDPTVAKGSTVLLFLEKYDGPVPGAEASFVCEGGYQGNYIISDGKISPSKNSDGKLSEDIEKIKNFDALKKKLNQRHNSY